MNNNPNMNNNQPNVNPGSNVIPNNIGDNASGVNAAAGMVANNTQQPVVNNNIPNQMNVGQAPVNNVMPQNTTPNIPQESNNGASTQLNNMNVNGAYNHMDAPPSYVNDQEVVDNVKLVTGQKKITVPVSKELKTVIIISLLLLAFIIVLPLLGDLLSKIRFH